MSFAAIATALLVLAGAGYVAGRRHAVASAAALDQRLPSLARHYGYWLALWVALPSFAVLALWLIAGPRLIDWLVLAGLPPALAELPPERLALLMGEIKALAAGQVVAGAVDTAVREAAGHYAGLRRTTGGVISALALAMAVAVLVWARRHITPALRARHQVEAILRYALLACSVIAVLVTLGIVLSLLFEAVRFFRLVPLDDFLFGLTWSPQTAIRADQVASAGAFGAIPVFTGTLLITFIAMLVAVPIGLFSAIYMVEYASPRVRAIAKPVIEILAGVPTVAYGALAALTVAPALRDLGRALGLDVASESALATGVVMGVMIIPFMSSLSDDVMNAVPQSLRGRRAGAGRDAVRDGSPGDYSGRAARHHGRLSVVDIARHRRDDDRGDGGWARGSPHGQPARGGDHGDRADRDAARRRPGVRQRQDTGRIRPWAGVVHPHPRAQCRRPDDRQPLPREVRMSAP